MELESPSQRRQRMSQAAAAGAWPELLYWLRQLLAAGPGAADILSAASLLKKMGEPGARAVGLRFLRTYIVRSVTVEPFLPYLLVRCAAAGFYLETSIGSYGAFIDDLMNPEGALAGHRPDLTLVFTDMEDVAGKLMDACAAVDSEAVAAQTELAIARFTSMLESFRRHSPARLLVQGLLLPDQTAQGDVADSNSPSGELSAIAAVNQALGHLCRRIPDTIYFDQDRLAARYGRAAWRDQRMFLSARVGVAARYFDQYTEALARSVRALYVPPKKVLCTDLDNTFWGGVVGEDGPEGIAAGAAFPGSCYLAFQKYLKGLSQRG